MKAKTPGDEARRGVGFVFSLLDNLPIFQQCAGGLGEGLAEGSRGCGGGLEFGLGAEPGDGFGYALL